MIPYIKEFFAIIPPATWGFIGTIIGALVSYLTIKAQLKHTTIQNKKEREISIRKQVYFEACDALTQMQAFIGNILKIDFNANIDPTKITGAIIRLHVVADIELIKKLIQCQTYFSRAFMELVSKRIVVEALANNAQHALKMHGLYSEQFQQLSEYYKTSVNPEGIRHEQSLISKKQSHCLEYHGKIIEEELSKRLEIVKKSVIHAANFSELASECVVDIRRDLENAFTTEDAETYKNLIRESAENSVETVSFFLHKIDKDRSALEAPDL